MIHIDFSSWQFDQAGITCYITSCGCLTVPGIVELGYIAQILDIETNFVVYNNKDGWNKPIDAIRTKWPEPPLDGPPFLKEPSGVIADTAGSSTDGPDIIDNSYSLNGTWTKYTQCTSNATQEQVPEGLTHCGWPNATQCTSMLRGN